jgi:hypothetical protein
MKTLPIRKPKKALMKPGFDEGYIRKDLRIRSSDARSKQNAKVTHGSLGAAGGRWLMV